MATIERSADLAVVGANGGGWCTDLGSGEVPIPTDFAAPTGGLLIPLGAISDDGLKYGFNEKSEEYTPWGLTSPFRTQTTQSIRTFNVTLWETNRPIVKSVFYRLSVAEVSYDSSGRFAFAETASPPPDRRSWIFDVIDGATMERFFVPEGEISDRSDVTFQNSKMAGYEITVTAYPDNLGNTVYHVGQVALPNVAGAPAQTSGASTSGTSTSGTSGSSTSGTSSTGK